MPALIEPPTRTMSHQDEILFAHRLPAKDFVWIKEIAAASGFSPDFVQTAYDNGKILGNSANASAATDKEQREHARVPHELAVLWLASIANHDAEKLLTALVNAAAKLPRELRQTAAARIAAVK